MAVTQDLLSGQFNVTLGDKLAEHLKKWIDVANVLQPPQPVSLCTDGKPKQGCFVRPPSSRHFLAFHPSPLSQVAWTPGTEWEVAAGMLDIFHKLPGAAKKFLETQGEVALVQELQMFVRHFLPLLQP